MSGVVTVIYDGTNMVLQKTLSRASAATTAAKTNTTQAVTPVGLALL